MMNDKRKTLLLKDGRQLTYCDQGNPDGRPVLLLHGAPGYCLFWNRLPGFSEAFETFRLISVDRRGYGTSDYKEGTTYLDYVDDISELMEHLELERSAVLGVSGGGPFSLACGYRIPEKISQVIAVSTTGPLTVEIEESLSSTNRTVYRIARRLPWVMNLNMKLLISWQKKDPVKYVQRMSYKLSGPDREAFERSDVQEIFKDLYLNSYRKTWKGYARDVILQANDWEFDLSRIEAPVIVIQALNDTSCPPAIGDHLYRSIPNCQLHQYDNAGHIWHLLNLSEILSKI